MVSMIPAEGVSSFTANGGKKKRRRKENFGSTFPRFRKKKNRLKAGATSREKKSKVKEEPREEGAQGPFFLFQLSTKTSGPMGNQLEESGEFSGIHHRGADCRKLIGEGGNDE